MQGTRKWSHRSLVACCERKTGDSVNQAQGLFSVISHSNNFDFLITWSIKSERFFSAQYLIYSFEVHLLNAKILLNRRWITTDKDFFTNLEEEKIIQSSNLSDWQFYFLKYCIKISSSPRQIGSVFPCSCIRDRSISLLSKLLPPKLIYMILTFPLIFSHMNSHETIFLFFIGIKHENNELILRVIPRWSLYTIHLR